jgi:hypothetical protein
VPERGGTVPKLRGAAVGTLPGTDGAAGVLSLKAVDRFRSVIVVVPFWGLVAVRARRKRRALEEIRS